MLRQNPQGQCHTLNYCTALGDKTHRIMPSGKGSEQIHTCARRRGRNSGLRVRLGTRLGEKIDERFDRTEQCRIQVSVGVNAGENVLPRLRHIRLRFVRLTQTT